MYKTSVMDRITFHHLMYNFYLYADLTSSDRDSEHFLRKLNRARFALARTDSVRSVSKSVYSKPPYRRAVSVPIHLLTKTAVKGK